MTQWLGVAYFILCAALGPAHGLGKGWYRRTG